MAKISELIHRSHDRYAQALSDARAAYTRGTLAMEENRWPDANHELIRCRRFMDLADLFWSHIEAFQQIEQGHYPSMEKIKKQFDDIITQQQ